MTAIEFLEKGKGWSEQDALSAFMRKDIAGLMEEYLLHRLELKWEEVSPGLYESNGFTISVKRTVIIIAAKFPECATLEEAQKMCQNYINHLFLG